jgi:uncharacterized SAM-binding protein YcdF (DUF218 family)
MLWRRVRRKWQTAAGAVVVAVAAALGGVSPMVSHSEPAAAPKDFSKTAIVILGNGLTGPTVAQFFPASRIILGDKASSTVQNPRFSVPLTKEAGTSGIILVTSTTHQGRADGDFADAGGNLLATVSYPDRNPSVNVAQFAHDGISPFVNVG